jgi:hypothetical protein
MVSPGIQVPTLITLTNTLLFMIAFQTGIKKEQPKCNQKTTTTK